MSTQYTWGWLLLYQSTVSFLSHSALVVSNDNAPTGPRPFVFDWWLQVPSMVSKYRQLSPSELLTRQWDDFHLRRRLSEMKAVNCSHLNGDGHGKAAGDAMVDAAK